jgi:Leucine-rich repeat (LRR) protein
MDIASFFCVLSMYLVIFNHVAECYNTKITCEILRKRTFVKIDCSSRGLTVIPDFCHNNDLLNNIATRKIRPDEIQELDLSKNYISNFNNSSFHCLKNLRTLNLERNHINLSSKNYIEGLFTSLVSLQNLNVKHNSKEGSINDTVFAELRELQVLRIDVPNGSEFGSDFSQLRKLHTLDLSGITGYCGMKRVRNETFRYFPYLRILDVSACMIKYVDKGAFGNHKHLEELYLSHNKELGFESLPNITFNLTNTKIQKLHLDYIRCFMGPATCLRQDHLKNLSATALKELSLSGNRLEWMQKGVLQGLPKSLRKLSLASNRLSLGMYSFEYRLLGEMTELNVSYQVNPPSLIQKLFQNCYENPDLSSCSSSKKEELSLQISNLNEKNDQGKKKKHPVIFFQLPPKLKSLYWFSSRLFGVLGEFGINAISLKNILFQNNIWYEWIGPVHGVEDIEELDLTQNFCYNISTEFLLFFSNVKTLKFGNNNLAKSLSLDNNGSTFRNQASLELLDLSNNGIESLPKQIFKNALNMTHLLLNGNRLHKWDVKITHMQNLTFLDLSDNRLTSFSSTDMAQLEKLFYNSNLTVDLTNNRFSCTCENIAALKWLVAFGSHFTAFKNYTCLEDTLYSHDLQKSVEILTEKCKSYLLYYVVGCIGCTLIVTISICYSIYRNRWRIRYLRYIANKKFRGYHRLQSHPSGEYEFDAYVSYSVNDLSFVKNEMVQNLEEQSDIKLAIMHRDMAPCGDHACNIMDFISRSKRTICVVSKSFLESDWQDYELNMARMEGIEARKSMKFVFLILMSDVCQSKYPRKASDFIKKGCYIEYPEQTYGQTVFWESLRKEIEKELPPVT